LGVLKGLASWVSNNRALLLVALVAVAVGTVVIVSLGAALTGSANWLSHNYDFLLVALLGIAVGTGEIVARYRDDPRSALLSTGAGIYLAFNALASSAALLFIRINGWTFGASGASGRLTQGLVAGFGAMALFRSSLFLFRVGNQDVAIGPAAFLQVILASADRAIDRKRAVLRDKTLGDLMVGIPYSLGSVAVPVLCLAMMQNLPLEDQQQLATEISKIDVEKIHEHFKVQAVGLKLMNLVGPAALEVAAKRSERSRRGYLSPSKTRWASNGDIARGRY
jgi:hypothetical protein